MIEEGYTYVELVQMDHEYTTKDGKRIKLVNEGRGRGYYKLKQLSFGETSVVINRFARQFRGEKVIDKKFKIVNTKDHYIKKVVSSDVIKDTRMYKAIRPIKPSQILIKHRQESEMDRFISTVVRNSADRSVLVPASMTRTVCPYCNGKLKEKCFDCDINTSFICVNCVNFMSGQHRSFLGCSNTKRCSIKTGFCSRRHKSCGKCFGKGLVYQYLEVYATQSKESKTEVRYEKELKQLQAHMTSQELAASHGDVIKALIYVTSMEPSEFFHAAAVSTMRVPYKEIEIELIPVKRVSYTWSKREGVMWIIGKDHVITRDQFPPPKK